MSPDQPVTKNPSANGQDAVEPVQNLWASSADLSWFQITQPLETYSRSGQTKPFEDQGEWVTSVDFKDAHFHIPIQEQSRKYLRFHIQGRAYQLKALPFGLSTAPLEGPETDGHAQGFKNPPVPRRLVGESQIPPGLSPTYTGTSK